MDCKLEELTALAEKIEAIVNKPETVTDLKNEVLRRRLREAGRKLSLAMEVTGDTVHRINNTQLQLAAARIGIQTGIFNTLAEANGSALTNSTLAEKTQVDPALMKRLLRYYQSLDMITQPGDDAYGANNITRALTSLCATSGVNFFATIIGPSYNALPEFLQKTCYAAPTDPSNCSWHLGHRTDLPPFVWMQTHPEELGYFMPWMATNRDGLGTFHDVLDFEREFCCRDVTDEQTVVFVDVGGAMGHQSIALRQRYPDMVGRVILQDQAVVIERVGESPLPGFVETGIEAMVHDFFDVQPVQGARAYYLRNVLHDWPDHKCAEILANIKGAMGKDSVVLIDEMVLPERGAPWRATQADFTMMASLAAKERSDTEWRVLLDEAGFKIRKIWKYTDECEDCIVVAVPKE